MGSYQSGQLGLTVTQLSFDFGGSNPSLPTIFCYLVTKNNCGSSSVDRALAFQAEGRGFEPRLPLLEREFLRSTLLELYINIMYNPIPKTFCCCSSVVEHFLGKEEVMGSTPINSSKNTE